jgi:hypothetical protein
MRSLTVNLECLDHLVGQYRGRGAWAGVSMDHGKDPTMGSWNAETEDRSPLAGPGGDLNAVRGNVSIFLFMVACICMDQMVVI